MPLGHFKYGLLFDFQVWGPGSLGLPLEYATEFATGALSMPLGRRVCHWGAEYATGAPHASLRSRFVCVLASYATGALNAPLGRRVCHQSAGNATGAPDVPPRPRCVGRRSLGLLCGVVNYHGFACHWGTGRATEAETLQLRPRCAGKPSLGPSGASPAELSRIALVLLGLSGALWCHV